MRQILSLSTLLLSLQAASPCQSGDRATLVPAESINSTFLHKKIVIVVEDDPGIVRYATKIRNQFFKRAEIIKGDDAVKANYKGFNVIVYGTVKGNAWLAKLESRLPFQIDAKGARVDRLYSGKRMRVICTMRNPQDDERQVLIYAAARKQDVVGMNSVFHGPTHWVVAQGRRVLSSGDFRPEVVLTPASMRTDLEFLAEKIGSVHPATADGMTEALQKALDVAARRVGKTTTTSEFWFIANQVLVTLADAHSGLVPRRASRRVDLPVSWLGDGLIINRRTRLLRVGDRVLSVGGKSEAELLTGLRRLISAENDQWVKRKGERALGNVDMLEALGASGPVAAGGTRPPISVSVDRGGKRLTIELERGAGRGSGSQSKPWARWHIEKEHSLGILTLDRCVNDEFYRETLKSFFVEVQRKKIKRIAVDLRRNSGGNSTVVDEFLRYIDVESYKTYSGEVRTSVDSNAKRGSREALGYRRYGPRTVTNLRHQEPEPFAGELFLLTSSSSFSSGSWFAVVVQDNGMGKILGEPTGNAPSSFGDILEFTMPASGFRFFLSFKKWVRPDASRDPATTLVPDVLIPRTRDHLKRGIDPVLEYLRK